jgi:hypothetical protein
MAFCCLLCYVVDTLLYTHLCTFHQIAELLILLKIRLCRGMLHHQQSDPKGVIFDSYPSCVGQIISCQGSVTFSSDSCHRHAVTGSRTFFSISVLS